VIRRCLLLGAACALWLIAALCPAETHPAGDEDRRQLPTGQFVTPLAAPGEIAAFVGDQTHHAGVRLSGIKRRRSIALLREPVSPRRT
jgi:hypothetical protein